MIGDYAPVDLQDDEQEQRKQIDYAPVRPPVNEYSDPASGTADLESRPRLTGYHPVEPNVRSTTQRPTWGDYAPVEKHGWGKIGQEVGQFFLGTGTREEKRAEEAYKNATAEYNAPAKEEEERAKTEELKSRGAFEQAHANAVSHPEPKQKTDEEQAFEHYQTQINPETNKLYSPTEAFRKVKEDAAQAKPEKDNDFEKFYKDYLTENNLPDSAHNRLLARKEFAAAGQAPEKPQRVLMMVPQPDGSQKAIEVTPGMTIAGNAAKPGEAAQFSRKDVSEHDKAYIQPAEVVEKSYQMMQHAYSEYEQARAQGKELPTGAQSMLALSTHLTTTFGNVKGARITKDLIQHHLGARSISDSALVAIQKLTNGDALSPDQWEAFHDLISQSRKLSWQTAAKEADRKHIPTDFLPQDLQNIAHEPGREGEELKPPKEPAAGMKWQHRTVNNKVEWRQVPTK